MLNDMNKPFTDEDAAKLVDCAVKLAHTTATDIKGPQPMAICCMKAKQGVMGVPTAFRCMDTVKATSATFAIHKAYTVLLYDADTKKHADRIADGSWSEGDMILMSQSIPQFTPWDGGIQVKDDGGNVVCSLGGAGRTSEGDRRLMVLAAHKMGYKTNFDEKGDPLIS
jgi:uncharacterized protein GlcG (DUF336 family)